MAPVREEVVLFILVLLAVGLVSLGLVDLMWPRAKTAGRARRHAADPEPAPVPLPDAPTLPMPSSVEGLIEQARDLAAFPLRALVLLRRADDQLAQLSGHPARLEALEDRLTAAHALIGCRLCEAGLAEQAVTSLIRAVSRGALGHEEMRRVRHALAAALGDIAEQRAQTIRRLAQEGNATAAHTHGDRLVALLRGALDSGLTETELAGALASAHRLFASLGIRRVVASG
jgi:hypothetical protein